MRSSQITVGELKDILKNYDDNEKVILQMYSSDARVVVGSGIDLEIILSKYK